MSNKKDICVVTWIGRENYGTCLQAYSLTRFLREAGYNPYMVSNFKFLCGIKHPIFTFKKVLNKIRSLLRRNAKKQYGDELFKERIQSNLAFQYSNIKIVNPKNDLESKALFNDTNIFITGSDQIWNPNYLSEEFLLFFCDKTKKRIAYSSSFGTNDIPKSKRDIYVRNLSKFERIGAREKTGLQLIKSLFEYNGKLDVVLDPVMLINSESWKAIEKLPHLNKELDGQKFVFSYFVGNKTEYDSPIKEFLKSKNIKSVNAVSESGIEHSYGLNLPYIDVQEFIWLLNHAEYILTDSFHLTALSIVFNKPFLVFKRFDDSDEKSQNSRIVDLLSTFGLSEKMYMHSDDFAKLEDGFDYKKINLVLQEKMDNSIRFLKEGIGND